MTGHQIFFYLFYTVNNPDEGSLQFSPCPCVGQFLRSFYFYVHYSVRYPLYTASSELTVHFDSSLLVCLIEETGWYCGCRMNCILETVQRILGCSRNFREKRIGQWRASSTSRWYPCSRSPLILSSPLHTSDRRRFCAQFRVLTPRVTQLAYILPISNKPFSFHPSKESADIGTEKRKKFRQRAWGSNPEPLVMRTSALSADLSRRSRHCND